LNAKAPDATPGNADCGPRATERVDGGGAMLSHGSNETRFLFTHCARHPQRLHGMSNHELSEIDKVSDEGLPHVEMRDEGESERMQTLSDHRTCSWAERDRVSVPTGDGGPFCEKSRRLST
jgi:hypothetical protein